MSDQEFIYAFIGIHVFFFLVMAAYWISKRALIKKVDRWRKK